MTRLNNGTSNKKGASVSKAQHIDAQSSQNKILAKEKLPTDIGFKEKRTPAGKATPTHSVKSAKSQNSISSRQRLRRTDTLPDFEVEEIKMMEKKPEEKVEYQESDADVIMDDGIDVPEESDHS